MIELDYRPAQAAQYDQFFDLMFEEEGNYLRQSLLQLNSSLEQFAALFQKVGKVYGVYSGLQVAGFYWIEEREKVLHLHALIIKADFQGQGIGTAILTHLVDEYTGIMDVIELGVHQSNTGAQRLYSRMGYRTVKELPDLGYYIMQRNLPNP